MFNGVLRSLVPTVTMALATSCGGMVMQGTGGTAVSGSAGGATSVDAASNLQRCDESLGTLAVDSGRDASMIEPLLRLAAQQSNCFVITSVGNIRSDERMTKITSMQRETGEFREGSRQDKGQRVAADYYVEPAVVINDQSVGAIGSGIGALGSSVGALGGGISSLLGPAVGGLAGALQSKASVVTLSLYDIRSQVQVSASEGSSTATNFGAALAAFGGGGGGGLGGLSTTPEAKATTAAFLDAYNGMVVALKNYKAQEVRGGLGRGGRLAVN